MKLFWCGSCNWTWTMHQGRCPNCGNVNEPALVQFRSRVDGDTDLLNASPPAVHGDCGLRSSGARATVGLS